MHHAQIFYKRILAEKRFLVQIIQYKASIRPSTHKINTYRRAIPSHILAYKIQEIKVYVAMAMLQPAGEIKTLPIREPRKMDFKSKYSEN